MQCKVDRLIPPGTLSAELAVDVTEIAVTEPQFSSPFHTRKVPETEARIYQMY